MWQKIAIGAVCTLFGGVPSYFFDIRERPTFEQVSHMILKEAPSTVASEIKSMLITQSQIQVDQARTNAILEGVLNELKRSH